MEIRLLEEIEIKSFKNINQSFDQHEHYIQRQLWETMDKAIMGAVEGWKMRAKLLLSLHSIFEGGDFAVAYSDSSTMHTMDLAFWTNIAKILNKIELSPPPTLLSCLR